jgi:glutathione S-transferase
MKLETWLRLADIPYVVAPLDIGNAPKGKVPYIIEKDGSRLGDSTFIIDHLTAQFERDPDSRLTAEQRATSVAFRRMMKEEFYWVIIQARYKDEHNWKRYRQLMLDLLDGVPEDQRPMVGDMYRQRMLGQMYGHGMGRHTAEEVYRIGIADMKAISEMLGDKPFFWGEHPTTVDATVYAYLANLIQTPVECSARDFGLSRDNLVRYCERMHSRFFPDLGSSAQS